ncbi:hypothetical protein D3C85_1080800 [compost metagenome]
MKNANVKAAFLVWCTTLVYLNAATLRDFLLKNPCRFKDLEIGGNPTSHTPAHNVTAAAAPFQA